MRKRNKVTESGCVNNGQGTRVVGAGGPEEAAKEGGKGRNDLHSQEYNV